MAFSLFDILGLFLFTLLIELHQRDANPFRYQQLEICGGDMIKDSFLFDNCQEKYDIKVCDSCGLGPFSFIDFVSIGFFFLLITIFVE